VVAVDAVVVSLSFDDDNAKSLEFHGLWWLLWLLLLLEVEVEAEEEDEEEVNASQKNIKNTNSETE
jgi:hypothetical protein